MSAPKSFNLTLTLSHETAVRLNLYARHNGKSLAEMVAACVDLGVYLGATADFEIPPEIEEMDECPRGRN
jgi:hypothetical protein